MFNKGHGDVTREVLEVPGGAEMRKVRDKLGGPWLDPHGDGTQWRPRRRVAHPAANLAPALGALPLPLPRAVRDNEPHLLSTYGNMWVPRREWERGESLSSII